MSLSRHLILPKSDVTEKAIKKPKLEAQCSTGNEYEKLETDIKTFYAKSAGGGSNSDDENSSTTNSSMDEMTKESACVLLHGALKVENMAALVLLNDDWFGFIYSYADSKKKSNLMLTILPPGKH